MRTCSSRGSPTTTLARRRLDRLRRRFGVRRRNDRLADRGAFLARLRRHLAHHFAHERVELRLAGRGVRPEHARVDRIGLADEAHRVGDDRRMRAQLLRGARRARERHDVLAGEMVERIAEAAADELQRAFRQDAGLDDAPDHQLGEIGSRRRRLHDRRHAGQQRRRQLLQHAPHREVERVDVDRRAFQRHADVLADERSGLRQTFDVAIDVDAAVRQLARAARCIREQRADAAVDVDPGIRLGRAGRIRERVELVLAIGQELRDALEQRRALVEREPPQRRPALATRVLQHAREIDAARRSLGDHLSRRRVAQQLRVALSCMPAALHIALQLHRILLSRHAACACR